MKKFRFKKMDAFASGLSGGNPAAAVYLDSFSDVTENEMQRIARELKGFVSEVGYIAGSGPDRYRLRYFSSEKEVQFCGHATIAIMYDLLKNAGKPLAEESVLLETNKGVLRVENRISSEDAVFVSAPVPQHAGRSIPLGEITGALGVPESAVKINAPIGIVNAGNETLCLPLRSLDDLIACAPDYENIRSFCLSNGLDVVTIFTNDVSGRSRAYRTRVFAAPFGYLEDPATGSGNAALGYHLLNNGLWRGEAITLEQNNDAAAPNIVLLSTKTDENGILRVLFGGAAVTRIDGYYVV